MKYLLAMTMIAAQIYASASGAEYFVDNAAPNADDANPGTREQPFRTINAAAQIAKAGDTVTVRAGVYRERVSPANNGTADAPVTFAAAPGETVEVKGSELWKNAWTADAEHPRVFRSKIDMSAFGAAPVPVPAAPASASALSAVPAPAPAASSAPASNPYATGISIAAGDLKIVARPIADDKKNEPRPRTLGQVFLNGEPLVQLANPEHLRRMPGAWIVSDDGAEIAAHLPGSEAPEILLPKIEWTVRDRIFAPRRRGLAHIRVSGFTFLHCANQGPFPQGGAVSTRTGKNWIIENNTIRFAKTIGLDIGSEYWDGKALKDTDAADARLIVQAGHIVRGNTISDNGLCGIAGWNSPGVLIYNNLLERNNRLSYSKADAKWEEAAAIKLHNSDAVIAGNTISANEAAGIWIDNGYNNSRITGNFLHNNLGSGIMLELGAGSALIDNNIIHGTRANGGFYDGNAIYAHDASGVTAAHNLLLSNAGAGVLMRTITARDYGGKKVETSGAKIHNNIFYENAKGAICLPYENPRSHGNASDHNVFIGAKPAFRLNKYQDSFAWTNVFGKIRAAIPGYVDAPPAGEFRAFSLEEWRAATGWDANSAVLMDSSFEIQPYRMLMRAKIEEKLSAFRVPSDEKILRDFAGDLQMRGHPGAFQNLPLDASEIPLTPYRYMAPPERR